MPLGENPSVRDAALRYAALGFRVVPVDKISKRPLLGQEWGKKASSDAAIISGWFDQWKEANVGICPDHDFCVLDIDIKNGGLEKLLQLEAEYGKLPDAVRSLTGGGGRHYYFRVDPSRELARKPFGKDVGIEIVYFGYQAIESPSLHQSGNRYQWVKDIELADRSGWPMAPEWFYKPIVERPKSHPQVERPYYNGSTDRFQAYCLKALANQRSELANVADGGRNEALNTAALKLAHYAHYKFFTEADVKRELQWACEHNLYIQEHGYKAFEASFYSGWNDGLLEPKFIPDREEYQQKEYFKKKPEYGPEVDPETGEIHEDGPEHKPRFQLIPFMEARAVLQARYLVKGLIPAHGLVIIWGPPKCGKSFWAADICAHIAAGLEYRGKRVRKGKVVYVAAEGASGFLGRLEAWRLHHPGDHEQMRFWTVPQRLNLVNEYGLLINDIRAQVGDEIPDIVALDTLNRTFSGSESSDEDMTAYVTAADAIKAEFGCAVIIIHHCGIEGTRPRGHTSLTGAADAQIAIKRGEESGIVSSLLEWMKDGEEGFETHSKLEVVDLGKDEDGDQVTTCVVIPSDEIEPKYHGRKDVPPGVQLVLLALHQAIAEVGEPHNSSRIPAGERVVKTELWRKYFYARSADANAETNRKAFQRGTDWLDTNGYAGKWEGLSWIIN